MKMILELGTMEAKNAVQSGALLGMLEVMADFEQANEAPARGLVQQFKDHAATEPSSQPTPTQAPVQQHLVAPMPNQAIATQPIYPTSMPGTAVNPQPPTGPIQQQIQPASQTVVPTSQAPTYTMDQLAVAATQLVDAGKRDALLTILANFGVQALTELPKDRYGEFATALRQQGVKI
jgi:hypothetical protein